MGNISKHRKDSSAMYCERHRTVGRERKAFRAKGYDPFAFLNEPVREIAYSRIIPDGMFLGNIDWSRNLPYLEASAKRWCELHNLPFDVNDSLIHPLDRVADIYRLLTRHTDEYRFDVDYDPKDGMLKFIEYRYCDFPEGNVFYLETRHINSYSGEMRELVLSFVSFVYFNSPFLLPEYSVDFSVILDSSLYEDEYFEEMEDEGRTLVSQIHSYTKGEAKALFREIVNVPESSRIPEHIRGLISRLSEKEKTGNRLLIESIEKGLRLLTEDELVKYRFFDGYCTDKDFDCRFEDKDFVEPERLFVLTYGDYEDDEGNEDRDYVADHALHYFSEEAQNVEVLYFRDARHLSPDDNETFEPSTYPLEWAKWFSEFHRSYS